MRDEAATVGDAASGTADRVLIDRGSLTMGGPVSDGPIDIERDRLG